MQSLTFQNLSLTPVAIDAQIWLSSADLANALGYSRVDNITTIYNRNADEFTSSMTALIPNPKMKNAKIRIFSLRGCHLIAMFSRTTVAKQFRQWVLDILDKEVGNPVVVTEQRHTISVEQQSAIRQAVAKRCKNSSTHYQTVYTAIGKHFNIPRYSELLASDFENAMAFIESFSFTLAESQALYEVLADNAMHLRDYLKMLKVLKGLPITCETMGRNTFEQVADSYNAIIALANQLGLTNRYNQPMFAQGRINFYNGGALITR
ncbi:BRO family protein [Moraxella sp. 7664RN]|uniref:BRO family protein n=1 Tax=Moraxella sp. 7664RN TaxID=3110541 RepID=UPI002B40419A|nr:BRO family protein [Moraxella sp. 7664RN]